MYVIFKAFRRLIDEIFLVIIVGVKGGGEGLRGFKCWLDLVLDDGSTLQEPHPPFMTKCLRLVIYV